MAEVTELLAQLEGKDTPAAYRALQELERISDETGQLCPYLNRFAAMTADERYAVRVRGVRLFCRQARWDMAHRMDAHLETVLTVLNDEKPTAVRQALAALHDVVKYRPDLRAAIARAVSRIDCTEYRDTMQSLIVGDIQNLLAENSEVGVLPCKYSRKSPKI